MAASSDEVVVSYIGQKVSKVRWAPVLSGRRTSDIFVSGSWDDPVSPCYFRSSVKVEFAEMSVVWMHLCSSAIP